MLLPCALLLCLAPCVFCCLPFLIRMSGFLPPGIGLRLPGQHGASERLISKLPPSMTYQRGMFGSASGGTNADGGDGARARGSPTINHDEPEWYVRTIQLCLRHPVDPSVHLTHADVPAPFVWLCVCRVVCALRFVLLLSAICLSNYSVGEEVRQLPCVGAHHFHRRCVDDWLKVKTNATNNTNTTNDAVRAVDNQHRGDERQLIAPTIHAGHAHRVVASLDVAHGVPSRCACVVWPCR
jgi:hypothetical protein